MRRTPKPVSRTTKKPRMQSFEVSGSSNHRGRVKRYSIDKPRLLARTDRTRQAAVVDPVGRVPKGLTQLNASTQDFDFLGASRRSIGCRKLFVFLRDEVLIVTVAKDCFEDVLAVTHTFLNFPDSTASHPGRFAIAKVIEMARCRTHFDRGHHTRSDYSLNSSPVKKILPRRITQTSTTMSINSAGQSIRNTCLMPIKGSQIRDGIFTFSSRGENRTLQHG